MLRVIASALVDFSDLTSLAALQLMLEGLAEVKMPTSEQMTHVVDNLATYLELLPLDASAQTWLAILNLLDAFLRSDVTTRHRVFVSVWVFMALIQLFLQAVDAELHDSLQHGPNAANRCADSSSSVRVFVQGSDTINSRRAPQESPAETGFCLCSDAVGSDLEDCELHSAALLVHTATPDRPDVTVHARFHQGPNRLHNNILNR